MEVVRRFARKCHSNERHCEQVATLAASIFDALKDAYALPASARDILQAAALLHDIGYLINHEKHHKHAYHLIMHGDLRGFSSREIELIANVARYHRRAPPKKTHANFARLDRGERRLVRRVSGGLRPAPRPPPPPPGGAPGGRGPRWGGAGPRVVGGPAGPAAGPG